MNIGIRGHDIAQGKTDIKTLCRYVKNVSIDTLQLVCYKSIEGIQYIEKSITPETAAAIGEGLRDSGVRVALLGAYYLGLSLL